MAKSAPQRVLTIQSHVTFGHVGNDAAVFTLQRLGIEAMPIHTVQFSNHTGYEIFTGEVFGADHIEAVMDGLVQNDLLNGVDAVLSGYLGSVAIGQVIHRALDIVRSHNPQAIYVCDPVMGDKDDVGGFFVDDTIPPFMQKTLAKASIITPNHFEFEVLCGRLINTLADAVTAARALMAQHDALHTVLITSFREDEAADKLMTLAITPSEAWCVTTPRCDYLPMPSGMGDTFSALYLGHILNGRSIEYAIRYTTSALYAFVMDTDNGARDLSIIREQAQMIEPLVLFDALPIV